PIITSIPGIRAQDVAGKPHFADIKDKLAAFIGSDPIVGHNIAFDIAFLRSQGLRLANSLYDTWKVATLMLPKAASHSLESLAQDLNLKHPEAHRALHDARVGADLLLYLADRVSELDQETSKQVLALIERNRYSLKNFFNEVLAGRAKGRPTPLKPGWYSHRSHSAERQSRPGKTLRPDSYEQIFKETVAPVVPAFELRPHQVELSKRVGEHLVKVGVTLIEAGAGLGRREAAFFAAANQSQTIAYVVASKHELEQFEPRARSMAALLDTSVASLETPQSYVYLPALERTLRRTDLTESQVHLALKLLIWVKTTTTGALREVAITWEERSLLDEVSCEAHSCLVQPEPDKCSFCRAAEAARTMPLVLMRLADLLWFVSRAASLFKPAAIVIDDADELENTTVRFFGVYVHQGRIERLLERCSDVLGGQTLETVQNQLSLLAGLVGVFLDHQALEAEWSGYRTVSISEALEKDPEYGRITATMANLVHKLQEVTQQLVVRDDSSAQEVAKGLQHLTTDLAVFSQTTHEEGVVSLALNADQKLVLRFEPVAAAKYLQKHLFSEKRPTIVMGPRLTVEQRFDFIKRRLGLGVDVEQIALSSALRLQERTKVVVISDHPESAEASWVRATAEVLATTAQTLGGRVLALFSGRGQVLEVHAQLEKLLAGSAIKLIAQGISGGRGKTTKTLGRHERALLLTSHYFMQGRTFAHGFRAIVIAKLPFAVPDETYRVQRAKDKQAGFMELDLPRVALKVREQFDRLLELPNDRGVLIILDPKIHKGYGDVITRSLPSVSQAVVPAAKLFEQLKPFAVPTVDKRKH
ncbi:MAG: exonuclease domain-containing protein, partial [Parcubacteria group bacterium]